MQLAFFSQGLAVFKVDNSEGSDSSKTQLIYLLREVRHCGMALRFWIAR